MVAPIHAGPNNNPRTTQTTRTNHFDERTRWQNYEKGAQLWTIAATGGDGSAMNK
jgi:hypothetical protein